MNLNRLSLSGTSAAFGVPATPQPPIPLSNSATYNLDRFSTNSAAVRDSIRADFPRKSDSELMFFDTKGSTEIGKLAGGGIGLAIGGEYREEKLKDTPDPRASSGDILGQGTTATDAKRDNFAIYGELSLPFTQMIEGQLAARYDHYSDYGSSTTPKVGLKIRPTSTLLLRANWGKGFRAPTLPEISPSTATFFTSVIDPLTGQNTQISGVYSGNPDLLAEKSTSTTVGLVWEPTRDFNVGLNYYNIDWKNIVSAPSFQSVVNAGGPAVIRDPQTNAIVTVLNNYVNLAQTKTNGVDLDARYLASTSVGKFTSRANFTYIDSFKEDGTETVGTNGGSNTMPRVRGTFSQDWDYAALSMTLQYNYIRGYYQQLLPGLVLHGAGPALPDRHLPGPHPELPHVRPVRPVPGEQEPASHGVGHQPGQQDAAVRPRVQRHFPVRLQHVQRGGPPGPRGIQLHDVITAPEAPGHPSGELGEGNRPAGVSPAGFFSFPSPTLTPEPAPGSTRCTNATKFAKNVGCFTRLWLLSGDQSRPDPPSTGFLQSKALIRKGICFPGVTR